MVEIYEAYEPREHEITIRDLESGWIVVFVCLLVMCVISWV